MLNVRQPEKNHSVPMDQELLLLCLWLFTLRKANNLSVCVYQP